MDPATDLHFMNIALNQARMALDEGEIPIGAVVVCAGRIVGTGHNMTETLSDPSAHAEMIAITAACNTIGGKYLNDCTIYVTVEPCPMCAAALAWAQVGRLVYGAPDPKRGYSLYSKHDASSTECQGLLHPRTEVTTGVLEEECSALVRNFFAEKR